MDPERIRGRGGGELALQIFPAGVEVDHPVLDLIGGNPGEDRIDQLLVIGVDLAQLLLQLGASGRAGGL
ncbi:hypothetical protein [Paenirhodobacter populi]|uniref:hypothetical protein n=1 Tax=Paenirhodobacter populi TaxID=2306993 RepID=UPI001F4F5F15|nr:hypothetical protein [Sinirhodobacter populi]